MIFARYSLSSAQTLDKLSSSIFYCLSVSLSANIVPVLHASHLLEVIYVLLVP